MHAIHNFQCRILRMIILLTRLLHMNTVLVIAQIASYKTIIRPVCIRWQVFDENYRFETANEERFGRKRNEIYYCVAN